MENFKLRRSPSTSRCCAGCGRTLEPNKFIKVKDDLFTWGFTFYCEDCLNGEAVSRGGDWDFIDRVCQWCNVPFIPTQWTKLWENMPERALSQYLRLYLQGYYGEFSWKEQQENYKDLIERKETYKIHSAFTEEKVKQLRRIWGSNYSEEQLEELEKIYQNLAATYGMGDALSEKDARTLAKTTLEIDKCMVNGGAGLDKLISAYNKLRDAAGFVTKKARDQNSFESISELMYYMEKTGWENKFDVDDTPQDQIDQTLKDIQLHNLRLWQNEPLLPEMVEKRLNLKARIEKLEHEGLLSENEDYDLKEVNAAKLATYTDNVVGESEEFEAEM